MMDGVTENSISQDSVFSLRLRTIRSDPSLRDNGQSSSLLMKLETSKLGSCRTEMVTTSLFTPTQVANLKIMMSGPSGEASLGESTSVAWDMISHTTLRLMLSISQ